MRCSHCGSTKDLLKYSKPRNIQYYQCRKCNTERLRKYRQTEIGRIKVQEAVNRYEDRNPEKTKAWHKVYSLPDDLPCEVKGCKASHTLKHHPDYSKTLEFINLCPLHHKQLHKDNS